MTTTTFVRAALALVALALGGCGGDGKKTRQSCDADGDCTGGVCFEQQCYAACTDQSACAEDELCVSKPRGDADVTLCVVAADFAPCASLDDCSALVPAPCQAIACGADGVCGFGQQDDGTVCIGPDRPGFCQVGVCVTGDTCPNGACTAGETCENCPGDCGCPEGQTCLAGGTCSGCTPVCDDRQCGPDGCGGVCGSCLNDCTGQGDDPNLCVEGACQQACCPNCVSKECGPDGCGGTCGQCPTGQACDPLDGLCVAGGAVCGDGTCGASEDCQSCSDDCPACAVGQMCLAGGGCSDVCTSDCDAEGKQCGTSLCGEPCGPCPEGQECAADWTCVPVQTCGNGVCDPAEDCGECVADCGACVVGYHWLFDDGDAPGFSADITADPWMAPLSTTLTPTRTFLGPFGKQTVALTIGSGPTFALIPGSPAPLPAGPLPAHDTVRLSFDLLILGSWDGHAATTGSTFPSMPDLWGFEVPSDQVNRTFSFANCVEDVQSYPDLYVAGVPAPAGNPAKSGAAATEPVVTVDGCGDATYRVVYTFGHAAQILSIAFTGNLSEYPGSTNLANESWGLDNVKVELLCEACGS